MNKNILYKMSLALFAALFLGCSNTTPKLYTNITSDAEVRSSFTYSEPLIKRDAHGSIEKAQLTLTNNTSFNQKIDYDVRWYDKNGFNIKGPTAYTKRVTIEPNRELVISQYAPSKECTDVEFYILTPYETKNIKTTKGEK